MAINTPALPTERKLYKGVGILLKEGLLTDFTIVCGTRTWAVHKLILSAQSEFFKKACDGRFQKATTARIDLPADDETALEAMVQYFHTLQYSAPSTMEVPVMDAMLHIGVQKLADKYDVVDRTSYATKQFISIIEVEWKDIENQNISNQNNYQL